MLTSWRRPRYDKSIYYYRRLGGMALNFTIRKRVPGLKFPRFCLRFRVNLKERAPSPKR